MIVAGVDISSKCGVSIVECHKGYMPEILHASECKVKSGVRGMLRAGQIAQQVTEIVLPHKPDIVYFEGYGFSFKGSAIVSAEIGTVTRYFLWQEGLNMEHDVSPMSLKLFVAGNGKAEKHEMIAAVYKHWGYSTESDNEADAIGLGMFGLAVAGLVVLPPKNMEAVYNFMAPPVKKPKKPKKKKAK